MRGAIAIGLLAAALAAPSALAAQEQQPWDGGAAVESPLELLLDQISTTLVGRPVKAVCNSPGDWATLATERGADPSKLLGYVALQSSDGGVTYTAVDETMQLSDKVCGPLDAYRTAAASAKGKECKVGERTEFRTETYKVKVKKKVKGKIKLVTITKTRKVPVKVPVIDICPGYQERVVALQTIAHEAQHLKLVTNEATAECYGTQYLRQVAIGLGATAEQAQVMGADYFGVLYEQLNPPDYKSPECRDGGALDLNLAPTFP